VGGEDDQQDGDAEEDLIDEVAEDEGQAADRADRIISMDSIAWKLHELADQSAITHLTLINMFTMSSLAGSRRQFN
jgi:hypothetical protein